MRGEDDEPHGTPSSPDDDAIAYPVVMGSRATRWVLVAAASLAARGLRSSSVRRRVLKSVGVAALPYPLAWAARMAVYVLIVRYLEPRLRRAARQARRPARDVGRPPS